MMGTTADKLEYLQGTKAAIKQAIVNKGVDVPADTTFRAYADKIGEISGGGESATVTLHAEYGGAPTPVYGILLITPDGEWQKINIDLGETKQTQVMKNSFVLPMVISDFDSASSVAGAAQIINDAQIVLENTNYVTRLVFVFGDCTITV